MFYKNNAPYINITTFTNDALPTSSKYVCYRCKPGFRSNGNNRCVNCSLPINNVVCNRCPSGKIFNPVTSFCVDIASFSNEQYSPGSVDRSD